MEESNTWAVVCSTHTIKGSVSLGHGEVVLRWPQISSQGLVYVFDLSEQEPLLTPQCE